MTIELCGATVHYEQYGQGAPLLLLHGWGCDTSIWQAVVRDLSRFRRITAIDFPGHGLSSDPPVPWDVGQYTQMTALFMDRLCLHGADILAHSFGGRVSIVLGATHPELVGKLLLTGCAGLRDESGTKPSTRARLYKTLRALADNPVTRAALGEPNVEKLRNMLRQRFGSADYRALKTDVMRASFNRIIAEDLRDHLPKIKAPTLLFFGDQDTATPLWMGQLMEREIPDAGLVVSPGGTHYAFLERYGEFLAVAKSFFQIVE